MTPPRSWFGRTPDHFTTRGAEVRRGPDGGWFVIIGRRIRGPLGDVDTAMDHAAAMLRQAERQDGESV